MQAVCLASSFWIYAQLLFKYDQLRPKYAQLSMKYAQLRPKYAQLAKKPLSRNFGREVSIVKSIHCIKAFVAREMLAPIAVIKACNLDSVAARMDKLVIADEDSHVRNSGAVRVLEKYQVADLR